MDLPMENTQTIIVKQKRYLTNMRLSDNRQCYRAIIVLCTQLSALKMKVAEGMAPG